MTQDGKKQETNGYITNSQCKIADTLVFSILLFGNHIKKFGSEFNQGFSFLSKSNLKCLCPTQCSDCEFKMRVLQNLSLRSERFCGAKSEERGFRRFPSPLLLLLILLSPHLSRGQNAEIPVLRSLLHRNSCYAGYVNLGHNNFQL